MSACLRALLAALFLLLPRLDAAAQTAPLRLCADPDNLPFSSSNPATPGIYVELGRQLAAALGRPFEPVWTLTYFGKHQVRTTLLAGKCDGFLGLPETPDFMGKRVILSKPILDLGYGLVSPRGAPINSLADLEGRRVAVQFGTPPQNLLATRENVKTVTVLSPEEAMRDLAQGKADAAFIWAPSAGWINHSKLHDAYKVAPVSGRDMQWQSAIGFRSDHAELRDAVDRVLPGLHDGILSLMAKYGFPGQAPISLAAASAPAAPDSSSAGGTAPSASAENIAAGHKLFNENCSHCHGPDAVEGIQRRNLRLLQQRYGNDMDSVFFTTVTHGRPTKGMPNWSGILTDAQFKEILAYLHSIQTPSG
jgi:polar amino acid transport system substrate-binding protein